MNPLAAIYLPYTFHETFMDTLKRKREKWRKEKEKEEDEEYREEEEISTVSTTCSQITNSCFSNN